MSAVSPSFSPTDSNKAVVERWFKEVWNQGRRETIFELWAPEAVLHDGPHQLMSVDDFAAFYDGMHSQFTEIKITPLFSLAENNLVCAHWTCSGVHKATQKAMQITGTTMVRFENGRFAEAWQNWDAAQLYEQLTGQTLQMS